MLVELLLSRSGYQLDTDDDTATDIVLAVAAGTLQYEALAEWFEEHIIPGTAPPPASG